VGASFFSSIHGSAGAIAAADPLPATTTEGSAADPEGSDGSTAATAVDLGLMRIT
jgi:hypothetical protein